MKASVSNDLAEAVLYIKDRKIPVIGEYGSIFALLNLFELYDKIYTQQSSLNNRLGDSYGTLSF